MSEFREFPENCTFVLRDLYRAGFTYGQDWAVAQGPPPPGGLHIFHGKKL